MNLIKARKTKITVAVLASALSFSAMAATFTAKVGFTTVPEITISQVTEINFGDTMKLATGATCIMLVNGASGSSLPTATMKSDMANSGAYTQVLTGDCGDTVEVGTPGIYEIIAVAGSTVKVTTNSVTAGTNFNFEPVGYGPDAQGSTSTVKALPADTETTFVVPSAANANQPDETAGVLRIALGGTITNQSTLSAGVEYEEDFTVDVTY